jgi:A-macroglobulin TED domain
MTSYALLTYIKRQDLIGGLSIAKWISAQRNANGGFSSTQVNNCLNRSQSYWMIITISERLAHSRDIFANKMNSG